MADSQATAARKQQGKLSRRGLDGFVADSRQELQNQYSTYKSTLQQLASKIGDVEQEAEEHKSVLHYFQNIRLHRR